jgi:hypothetical protein
MSVDEQLWATIGAGASSACAEWLRNRLAQPGLADLTAKELAVEGGCQLAEAEAVLERAVTAGLLTQRLALTCPCCDEELAEEELADGPDVCPHCSRAFRECGAGVEQRVHYLREAEPGRSVPWVLVLHGMNTRGRWQEELSWLVATTYGRSVPVFIFKYGRIATGVLLGWRRRSLVRKLTREIEGLAGEREHDRLGPRPDVIAHSFGTWMLGHALASTDPEVADLAVGRVVLLGSILRPNFPWAEIIARGRAEAVLNHYGTADSWAGIGGYVIYDAGPSGRRGFDPTPDSGGQPIINRAEPGFEHSTFFQEEIMRRVYLESWKPFLIEPLAALAGLKRGTPSTRWRPPPRVLRFGTAAAALGVVAAIAIVLTAALVIGLIDIANRVSAL